MSEQTQTPPTQPLAVVQAKSDIEFKPFGSEDAIKLSLSVIKNYVAVLARDRQSGEEIAPDDRECMRFMMLCRTQRLNPFAGDAFMVPFWDGRENRYKWNLITGITTFYKRAELHPEFDGIESGVIVEDGEGTLQYREGDFTTEGDKCVGGWATVHFKQRKWPMRKRVKLSTYQKTFGVWTTDPQGMICKVAEAQALRDAFPTMLGGTYLREEYHDIPAEVIESRETRRPDFAKALPPVSMEHPPTVRKAEKTTPKTPQEPPEGAKIPPKEEKSQVQSPATAQTPSGKPAEPPQTATTPPQTPETSATDDDEKALAEAGLAPEQPKAQEQAPAAPAEPDAYLANRKGESDACASVKLLATKSGVSGAQLRGWLVAKKLSKPEQGLHELSQTKLEALNRTWQAKLPEIRAQKV